MTFCLLLCCFVLPHQRLWTFDVLVCPLSATAFPVAAARLWNSLPSHVTAALSLSPSSAVILNHISSNFLIPHYNSTLICTVAYSARAVKPKIKIH